LLAGLQVAKVGALGPDAHRVEADHDEASPVVDDDVVQFHPAAGSRLRLAWLLRFLLREGFGSLDLRMDLSPRKRRREASTTSSAGTVSSPRRQALRTAERELPRPNTDGVPTGDLALRPLGAQGATSVAHAAARTAGRSRLGDTPGHLGSFEWSGSDPLVYWDIRASTYRVARARKGSSVR
jgi:hypothetical protein